MKLKEKFHFILKILRQEISNPKTELLYESPFQLLAAVLLSAQSTDKQVNLACRNLFKKVYLASEFNELSIEELTLNLKSIGLYKTKVKNLKKTARCWY